MKTKIYKINREFARANHLPMYFAGVSLVETPRAVYLHGKGTIETAKLGVCCICGMTLTHPVSVKLGIGPECGRHYWDWDLVGGYTEENVKALTQKIQSDITVNSWLPKSVIKEVIDTTQIVVPPADHPMLTRKVNTAKKVEMVTFQSTGRAGLKISFPYNVEDLNNVKSLFGRKFHNEGATKYWSAELNIETLNNLESWGFILDENCQEYLNQSKVSYETVEATPITGLEGKLFPFQEKGVAFIKGKGGRALIGDEMGLGKTVQALAYIASTPKRPAIIVVPASLKINWKREAEKWVHNCNVQVLNGSPNGFPIIGDIIVINYDILEKWVDRLKEVKPQIIVTDECHYYKNKSAKRTKAVKALAKGVPHFIALSGTPLVNRPIELFNAINIIKPELFPNYYKYAQRYCGAKYNGFGWDYSGASNTEELHRILKDEIMIRRLKSEVLTELPGKLRSFVPIELDNRKEYQKAEADLIEWIRFNRGNQAALKASQAEVLVRIETLKQLAVTGKLDEAIGWITDFIESGDKLVMFANHKFVIDRLMQVFGERAVKIDGSVSQENRQLAVDQFQNNPAVQLFVGNIKAAGVGLTLTAASNVAFLELPWTPGELQQAEDRCHRIGQKDTVNIYYLLAESSIEETIAQLIDKKMRVLDAVLDGKETSDDNLLTELLKKYES